MISASSLLLSHFSALTVSSQKRLFDVRKTEILEGAGCWYTRERLAGLDLLKGNFYGLQKLLVNAGSLLHRIIVQEDVRIHAVVLHDPLASLGVVVGEERNAYVSAVKVRQRSADTDDSAPGPGSDDGSKVVGLEAPREQVSVRSRVLVYQ